MLLSCYKFCILEFFDKGFIKGVVAYYIVDFIKADDIYKKGFSELLAVAQAYCFFRF